jgi:hypothetical protein
MRAVTLVVLACLAGVAAGTVVFEEKFNGVYPPTR